jgi:hypothetical protein
MNNVEKICKSHRIVLCYLFGSQVEIGKEILEGKSSNPSDPEADLDFAVLFEERPIDALNTYARISLEFQSLVSPFKADLLFLHEVDHLIQLEAIKGVCLYAADDVFREEYEERVMMFAADELEVFRRNEKDLFEAIDHGYFDFEYQAG